MRILKRMLLFSLLLLVSFVFSSLVLPHVEGQKLGLEDLIFSIDDKAITMIANHLDDFKRKRFYPQYSIVLRERKIVRINNDTGEIEIFNWSPKSRGYERGQTFE